jgi:hypothetical protein
MVTKLKKVDGRTARAAKLDVLKKRYGIQHKEAAVMLKKLNGIVPSDEEWKKSTHAPQERQLPDMRPEEILAYSKSKKQELENRRNSLSDQLAATDNEIQAWDRYITAGEA